MNPLVFDTTENIDSPVIVALDCATESQVMRLVEQLDPSWCKLKIGKELFTSCGPKLVEKLVIGGYKIFLDLKFHDIPNTVHKACIAASDLGVWMINVHASGGSKMLEMAKQGVDKAGNNTLLIAVTVLTSMSQADLTEIGITQDINTHITNLAKLSYNNGLDGVVCSAYEAAAIKQATQANFLTVTPGIRLPSSQADDQERIMTPVAALNNQADYLVIGRPITEARNPQQQLLSILSDIKQR